MRPDPSRGDPTQIRIRIGSYKLPMSFVRRINQRSPQLVHRAYFLRNSVYGSLDVHRHLQGNNAGVHNSQIAGTIHS